MGAEGITLESVKARVCKQVYDLVAKKEEILLKHFLFLVVMIVSASSYREKSVFF